MESDSLLEPAVIDTNAANNVSILDTLNSDTANAMGATSLMPTPKQLGISVTTESPGSVVLGDTFEYPVTVSWSVQGSALLVMPTGSASAKGLTQVGLSQESARMVKEGKEVASIKFTYKLTAQDTGNLNIPVLRFEIPTSMGEPLVLKTESSTIQVTEPVSILPIAVGIVVAVLLITAGVLRSRRRAKKQAALAAKKSAENALLNSMLVLKQRVNTADSREWLLELETICKGYIEKSLGVSQVNLDTLQKSEDLDKLGDKEGWNLLLEEFAHARYGGGKRDSFVNKETWKRAMKLMGVEEE